MIDNLYHVTFIRQKTVNVGLQSYAHNRNVENYLGGAKQTSK